MTTTVMILRRGLLLLFLIPALVLFTMLSIPDWLGRRSGRFFAAAGAVLVLAVLALALTP